VIQQALAGMVHILKAGRAAIAEKLPYDVYASAFRTSVIGIAIKPSPRSSRIAMTQSVEGSFMGSWLNVSEAADLIGKLKDLGP